MKELRFKRKYFEMVVSRKKNLEARINYPSLRNIKAGDQVLFFWEDRSIKVLIHRISLYRNFDDMLNNEDSNLLVPGMNKEEALKEYQSVYPKWKLNKFKGVRVFEFEVI
jgi:ASC-1-like (ASCH) protein